MDVGLLWYDNDPRRALEDKIGLAARRYRERYGRWPDTCFVHPLALGQGKDPLSVRSSLVGGPTAIRVISAPNVLVHHLWLGEWVGGAAQEAVPSR